jgi:hypothetical protein
MLVQSLNDKQVILVRDVKLGNAYAVWHRLLDNYGIIVSAASKHTLMSSLINNGKLPSDRETVSDYFARTDRIIEDIDVQSENAMDDSMKRFHYLNGLARDEKWSKLARMLTQIDADETWSLEKVKQYFIGQENDAMLLKEQENVKSKHVEVGESKVEVKVTDKAEKALSSQRTWQFSWKISR